MFLEAGERDSEREVKFLRAVEKRYGEVVQTVFDLGCGVGRHAKLLASYYSVYGVDISSVEIELARKVTPQCHFEVGDMRTWRPSVHAEMLICMWSTFNYLSTDNDVKAFVDTTTANSSPGSLLVIDVKNPRRVIDETYERISYAYPYEIDITVTRKISSAGVRNGIYKYHIHNQLNGTSIVVTDQELNRIYEESRIREAFVPYFQLIATFGDYDLDTPVSEMSERLILAFKRNSQQLTDRMSPGVTV